MKETGIIMSGVHPQLVLDGLKSQTRRTAGLNEINENPDAWGEPFTTGVSGYFNFPNKNTGDVSHLKCPYGGASDFLWTKEAWRISGKDEGRLALQVQYKADMVRKWIVVEQEVFDRYTFDSGIGVDNKWRSSRFMPRWAARIWLEITGLRAERVQDINEKDARAEGANFLENWGLNDDIRGFRGMFKDLWDSLNAKRGYGWRFNPWVWVISFKRLAI